MTLLNRLVLAVAFALAAACETAPSGGPPAGAASPSAFAASDITIESGGVPLAATLLTPVSGNGLGVVMLPGSGPATRATIRPAAEELAKRGLAVLIFDKRGSGASGGDWTKASLDDLAADAIAAMAALESRAGVRVGLWAHSQGNWVATRAAEKGAAPAFLIAVSGGGAAPGEVERYAYAARVRNASPTDQTAAMALVDAYFDYLAGDLSRADLDARIAPVKYTEWYEQLGIARVLVSEAWRDKWRWVADYDPALDAANRTFPTLVLLGGADHSIPLGLTIADWNRQLAENKAGDRRIVTFVGRGHHLRVVGEGHGHGVSTDPTIWNEIGLWLGDAVR